MKYSEENKKETDSGNQTNNDNMDEVQPVNSDNAAKGDTSENSASTKTPTPNRMRTCSSKSNDGDPSRKASSQNTQKKNEIQKPMKMMMMFSNVKFVTRHSMILSKLSNKKLLVQGLRRNMCARNATKHLIRKHISSSTLITDTQTRSHNLFVNRAQKHLS